MFAQHNNQRFDFLYGTKMSTDSLTLKKEIWRNISNSDQTGDFRTPIMQSCNRKLQCKYD